jgi:hypothetical protein
MASSPRVGFKQWKARHRDLPSLNRWHWHLLLSGALGIGTGRRIRSLPLLWSNIVQRDITLNACRMCAKYSWRLCNGLSKSAIGVIFLRFP